MPRERDNMVRPPETPDGAKRTMYRIIGLENIATTAEHVQMRSTTYCKKAIKSPGRCGKHHVLIK